MKTFSRIIMLASLVCAVILLALAYKEKYPYLKAESLWEQVREEYGDPAGEGTDATFDPDQGKNQDSGGSTGYKNYDWDALKEINPDAAGWITIPGTSIDYPLLQGTDEEFYLHHDLFGGYNILGSLFLNHEAAPDLSDPHTIIYGHNMDEGQMFGRLSEYQSVDFWSQHQYVYIHTPKCTYVCVVYSAYTCRGGDGTYRIGFTKNTEEYSRWLQESKDSSLYDTGVMPGPDAQIFTLSTCTDSGSASDRFVVQAVVSKKQ